MSSMDTTEVNQKDQIPDELWQRLQPLLPVEKPKPKRGRPHKEGIKEV